MQQHWRREILVLATLALLQGQRAMVAGLTDSVEYRQLYDYAKQFAFYPPPATAAAALLPESSLLAVIKSGQYAYKNCRRYTMDDPLAIYAQDTGLRLFRVPNRSNTETAFPVDQKAWVKILNDDMMKYGFPFNEKKYEEAYFCCDDCDSPYEYEIPQYDEEDGTLSETFLYGAIWCQKSVLGQLPHCVCDPAVASAPCATGTYRSGCRYTGDTGQCVPCTNQGITGVVYGGPGTIEGNDCPFQCADGFYFDKQEQGFDAPQCRECTVCADGEYVAQACSPLMSFTDATSADTKCRPCPLGHNRSATDNTRCVPCGYGSRARTDGPGCVECEAWQYTTTAAATVCIGCDVGADAPSRRACRKCFPGSARSADQSTCQPCPIGSVQPLEGQGACEMCTDGGIAPAAGLSACTACAAGEYANPPSVEIASNGTVLSAVGSWRCLPCDRRRVPSNSALFTFHKDCTWSCVAGYYRDVREGECIACNEPCAGVGTYRPACTGTETRLPACIACSPANGTALAARTRGQHYDYTTPGTCDYKCLPGYDRATACAPCAKTLPANAAFVGEQCTVLCNRGFTGATCAACTAHRHPRTLGEVAAFAPYFGDSDLVVDFAACNDAALKEFGVQKTGVSAAGAWLGCGNGVLERKREQCDDGNALSGDGCSASCTLEGGFRSCWSVGQPCGSNCGFSADEMYAHYLTDPTCSKGPKAADDRKVCGDDCATPRTPYAECTAANRGCIACLPDVEYINAETQGCSACGSDCGVGYYAGAACEPLAPGFDYAGGTHNLSEAQRGCYPCREPSVTAGAAVFTATGRLRGNPASCPVACTRGTHYCSAGFDAASGECGGTCAACTDPAALVCGAGFYATGCTENSDATCVSCGAARPGSVWIAVDGLQCAWACLSGYQKVPAVGNGICDPCATDKICSDYHYAPAPCDGEPAGAGARKYCKRCPDPADSETGVEVVGSSTGACTFACMLHRFFSPDYPRTPCTRCAPPEACTASERFVQCSRREDAQCQPCDGQDAMAAANLEFYVQAGGVPECSTRCRAGFALHPSTQQCTECVSLCDGRYGDRPEHACEGAAQRAALPQCVPCSDTETKIPEHAHYVDRCAWQCDRGYHFHRVGTAPATCELCRGCAVGEFPASPVCSELAPALTCLPCSGIPENAVPISSTSPDCPWICAPGYYEVRRVDGTPVQCAARWVVRDGPWVVPNATTSTTPPPSTTPRPTTPAPDPLPNFPKRRVRTSAGCRALPVRMTAHTASCMAGCMMTSPQDGGLGSWAWCTSLCILVLHGVWG